MNRPSMYWLPFGWRCSAGCGIPILRGMMRVQTSPDTKALEYAHVGCATPRKGIEVGDPGAAAAKIALDVDGERVLVG